jgi:hypothetical protein
VWGHGGVFAGVTTRVNIDPVNRDGFVMLLNGQNVPNLVNAMDTIENRAFRVLAER